MTTKMKAGRPSAGAEAETAKVIHVGLDAATLAALERLERDVGPGVNRGRRSVAVRALLDAAARLRT